MDCSQSFRFITWNLQHEAERDRDAAQNPQVERLSFSERMLHISRTMQRLASTELPAVFCLQEVDQAMSAKLDITLPNTWQQILVPEALQGSNGHTSVICYDRALFAPSLIDALPEESWMEHKRIRWVPIARLTHLATGIVFDVLPAHLRGFSLRKPDALRAISDCQLQVYLSKITARREDLLLTSVLAFQIIGMDANRPTSENLLATHLAAKGAFQLDNGSGRTPTNHNHEIGPVSLDCIAVAATHPAARVNSTWEQVDPGYSLPASRPGALIAPSDHLPSMTCVTVSRSEEQVLDDAMDHLKRLAKEKNAAGAREHVQYLKEGKLLLPLGLRLLRRCLDCTLPRKELSVAKFLGLKKLTTWQAPEDDNKRIEQLTALLLRSPSRYHVQTLHYISELNLQLKPNELASLIRRLDSVLQSDDREQLDAIPLYRYICQQDRTTVPVELWKRVSTGLLPLLPPQLRLTLLEQSTEHCRSPEMAQREICERISQHIHGTLQGASHTLSRLLRIGKLLPPELHWATLLLMMTEFNCSRHDAKSITPLLKRFLKRSDTSSNWLTRSSVALCRRFLEVGKQASALEIYKTCLIHDSSARAREMLKELMSSCHHNKALQDLVRERLVWLIETEQITELETLYLDASKQGLPLGGASYLQLHQKLIKLSATHSHLLQSILENRAAAPLFKAVRAAWMKAAPQLVAHLGPAAHQATSALLVSAGTHQVDTRNVWQQVLDAVKPEEAACWVAQIPLARDPHALLLRWLRDPAFDVDPDACLDVISQIGCSSELLDSLIPRLPPASEERVLTALATDYPRLLLVDSQYSDRLTLALAQWGVLGEILATQQDLAASCDLQTLARTVLVVPDELQHEGRVLAVQVYPLLKESTEIDEAQFLGHYLRRFPGSYGLPKLYELYRRGVEILPPIELHSHLKSQLQRTLDTDPGQVDRRLINSLYSFCMELESKEDSLPTDQKIQWTGDLLRRLFEHGSSAAYNVFRKLIVREEPPLDVIYEMFDSLAELADTGSKARIMSCPSLLAAGVKDSDTGLSLLLRAFRTIPQQNLASISLMTSLLNRLFERKELSHSEPEVKIWVRQTCPHLDRVPEITQATLLNYLYLYCHSDRTLATEVCKTMEQRHAPILAALSLNSPATQLQIGYIMVSCGLELPSYCAPVKDEVFMQALAQMLDIKVAVPFEFDLIMRAIRAQVSADLIKEAMKMSAVTICRHRQKMDFADWTGVLLSLRHNQHYPDIEFEIYADFIKAFAVNPMRIDPETKEPIYWAHPRNYLAQFGYSVGSDIQKIVSKLIEEVRAGGDLEI